MQEGSETGIEAAGTGGHLQAAREAFEANDSTALTEECRAVLAEDPENAEAWLLLAKFGGWDAKFYRLDIDFAVDAAKHALGLLPDAERIDAASQVYDARKRQIALMLDEGMLNLTTKGAARIHEVMMDWLRLLEEIPSLPADTIKSEITLCENLCGRSRIGIMPSDRMVYTAYKAYNGKETYGETFRRVLGTRLEGERAHEEEAAAGLRRKAQAAAEAARGHLAAAAAPEAQLRDDLAELQAVRDALVGLTQRGSYERQVAELEGQLAKLKSFQVFKVAEVRGRIGKLREAIAGVDAQLEPDLAPIDAQLEQLRARLGGDSGGGRG